MCKTISIINQKGGVGKSTTCINLAASLVKHGKRVLAIDLDSQANLTMGMGYDNPDEIPIKLADLLQHEITNRSGVATSFNVNGSSTNANESNGGNNNISSSINQTFTAEEKQQFILSAHGVDFIPSSLDLAGLELTLMNTIGRETVLKSLLEQLKGDYDYILIDCLPSLGIFTVNALTASDEIIIPVQAQYFGAKGVEALLQSVASVQTYLNPKLKVLGILITMLDGRSVFQKEVKTIVQNGFAEYTHIFDTTVPMSVEVSRQQAHGTPIVSLKNNSVSAAYSDFAKEVLSYEHE